MCVCSAPAGRVALSWVKRHEIAVLLNRQKGEDLIFIMEREERNKFDSSKLLGICSSDMCNKNRELYKIMKRQPVRYHEIC